jgi:hypothetical protein
MATRSERFKAEMEQAASHANRAAKPAPTRAELAARAEPRTAQARARARVSHNDAPRVAKNSSYEIESSGSLRPPRKSTRRSPTHVKTDSALRIAAMNKNASPQARAQRRGGKTT